MPNLDQAIAQDTPALLAQVTSVNQLPDVKPSDWAYQSLQSLIERYGCVVGQPYAKFEGNRPATRYEVAAALNACMDKFNELIAQSTFDLTSKADIVSIQESLGSGITRLTVRVKDLESKTAPTDFKVLAVVSFLTLIASVVINKIL